MLIMDILDYPLCQDGKRMSKKLEKRAITSNPSA
jgi:hypothetical protein